jgi:protein-disulfide isomerase
MVSVLAAAVGILLVLVSVATTSGGSGGSLNGQSLTAAQVHKLLAGIPQHGITLGRPDAPVTITEFADLQCPFCQEYTVSESPTIVSKYVRTGKIKFVFRNLTFIGPQSTPAAQAAAAAGLQNKLWDFADIFYANQGEENSGYVTNTFLTRIGSKVDGLSVDQMMSARTSRAVAQQLVEARTLAKANHVTGTPTFIVLRAGRKPVKVFGASSLQAAINRALEG